MRKSFRRIPRKQEEIFKIKTDSNFIGLLRLGFLGILILAQVAILIVEHMGCRSLCLVLGDHCCIIYFMCT